jgi:hypothetical protein
MKVRSFSIASSSSGINREIPEELEEVAVVAVEGLPVSGRAVLGRWYETCWTACSDSAVKVRPILCS